MARWADVIEAERREKVAVKAAASALAEVELLLAFIRETGQKDTYIDWFAKRIGLDLEDVDSSSPEMKP